MSNYNNLKTAIDANIKQNGNQEITGPILNSVLNQMVNILGTGYQFAGVATLDPATEPGTPDAKVFYIANGKGTYTNFGGIEVTEDDVVVLYWDTAWHKVATGIASQAKLSELDRQITGKAESLLSNIGTQRIPFDFVAGQKYEFEIIATANSTIGFYDAQDTLLAVIARSPSVVSAVAPNGAVSIGAYFNAKTTINITDLSAIEPSVKQSREATADNSKGINLLNGWVDRGTLYNTLVPAYDRVCAIYPIDDVESTYKLELSKISLAGGYMFWKFSTDASVGTSSVGSVTYIYNVLDKTYDIALTDEQKARAKYLVVTFATNVQGAFFARLYKDNSALVKDYLELEKQEIGTARLLKAATFINANNAKRCFVLDGQISFNVGGETITLSGTIPYTWDRTTAMSWYAYVYDSHSKTFYFTSDILPYCYALFSFVAIGRSSQGDCRVYNFVFCPIAYKVDGVADFEIKSRTYNGEKIDLSSHRYDKTILFSNTDANLSHPSNVQGGAIYADRYLAQIVHETSATYLAIIDMDGVVKLGEFNIGLPEPCHGNCISFGKKQNANDVFPLLYISQGDATNNSWKCFVVKIADNAASCSLVSTISYNGSRYENTRQIDWCVDIEHKSLWSYSKTQENNTTEFCRYDLPLITDSDVILGDADIKESFIVDKYINQQVCFLGNKILCCSGVLNSFAPPFIYAIDIERQKVVTSIDVDWIGEPQNCFRFKETLVVGTSGTNYYTLSV